MSDEQGEHTTGGTDLDVEGRDAELLAAGSYRSLVLISSFLFCSFLRVRTDVLGSQHGGVGGGLVTVGLDLHATGDTRDGLATRQIGDMDKGIIEGRKNTGHSKNELALCRGQFALGGAGRGHEPRALGARAAQVS